MRALSKSIRDLFRGLYRSWNGPSAQSGGADEIEHLRMIGELRDPAAIPELVGILYNGSEAARDVAAGTIEQIVRTCDVLVLAQLDGTVRKLSEWRFPAITPDSMVQICRGLTGPLGMISFGSSGYTREAAVRLLARDQSGLELPFLLIRLNDWVGPVGEVAERAVVERIRPEYAKHFIRYLPLVSLFRGKTRKDLGSMFEAVGDLLCSDDVRPLLQKAMLEGDRRTRKLAFRLLVDRPNRDLLVVLKEAVGSRDVGIRYLGAHELCARLEGKALVGVLELLIRDRFMPLRRVALIAYAERLPELARDQLRSALLDRHKSMREVGRFYLSKVGETDFGGFYESHLDDSDEHHRAAAVAGLGEVGTAKECRELVRFVKDPSRLVRRAAVRAVGQLDPEVFFDQLMEAMEDKKSSVAKAARDALLARPDLLEPKRLWKMFEEWREPHVRTLVLPLIWKLQWWESAPLLVLATGYGDPSSKSKAINLLERWEKDIGRLIVWPSDQQLNALKEAIHRNRGQLTQKVLKDLEAHVSMARR